jgi:hypothetical protein
MTHAAIPKASTDLPINLLIMLGLMLGLIKTSQV